MESEQASKFTYKYAGDGATCQRILRCEITKFRLENTEG